MEKAVIPGPDDIKTYINLDEALTGNPPFNPEFIAKAFETNGLLVLNITTNNAGSDRGVWTFRNEEEGWIKVHSKNDSQNGNMHVTSTGQIYVANSKGIFHLVELEPDQFQWIALDWVGKEISKDLAGDDQFLYPLFPR